jgi:hypothetical protein
MTAADPASNKKMNNTTNKAIFRMNCLNEKWREPCTSLMVIVK